MLVDQERAHGVDALRGLAACAIVVLHAAYIHDIGIPRDTFIRYFTMGVPLFFVISAFSMSLRYSEGFADREDLIAYGIRRVARIAPLFYVMLIIWLAYLWWLGSPGPSVKSIILNLTFLFSLTPDTQTSIVPAGWSIGIEMLFYAIFPLLIRVRSLAGCSLMVASTLLCYAWFRTIVTDPPIYFYWTHPITNATYFACGILAYRIYEFASDFPRVLFAKACLILGVTGIVSAIVLQSLAAPGDAHFKPPETGFIAIWGIAFMALVLSQAINPTPLIANRVTLFLGLVSYSIYLIHPLLIYASPLTPVLRGWEMAWPIKIAVAGAVALSAAIIAATVLYRFVEAPGQQVGRYLVARLKQIAEVRSPTNDTRVG
jgi:peptidoglycan/LPS O-acetylase OafA/YrhL